LRSTQAFRAAELLIGDKDEVVGVATGDMGIAKNGRPKADFTRGMELRAKKTILAEGARGSLTKQIVERYALNKDSDHQKYGIGIKELWEARPEVFRAQALPVVLQRLGEGSQPMCVQVLSALAVPAGPPADRRAQGRSWQSGFAPGRATDYRKGVSRRWRTALRAIRLRCLDCRYRHPKLA
jgi:hypothetical protein